MNERGKVRDLYKKSRVMELEYTPIDCYQVQYKE